MTEFLETDDEVSEEPDTDVIVERKPMMSGHCRFPQTAEPHLSHERCARRNGGSRQNPMKEWRPCSCACHLGEQYECDNCGRVIAEAPLWLSGGDDSDEDMVYVHLDTDGSALGEACP